LYKYIIVIVSFFAALPATAQTSQQYLFSYLGTKDGLADEQVSAVQQDAKGYIWVAAGNTLQRYDGKRFLTLYHNDNNNSSIPAGDIRGLQIDKKNRLWLLSGFADIGYLDADDLVYHPVKVKMPARDVGKSATALHVDKDGNVILIFVSHCFLFYNSTANEIAEKYNPFTLPEGWLPYYVWQDAERNYWVGSSKGLIKYSVVKKMLSYRGHNDEADPVIQKYATLENVNFAYVDSKKRFWLTAWPKNDNTIKSFDIISGEETEWKHVITAAMQGVYYGLFGITEMSDGSLWLAGDNLFARLNYPDKTVLPVKNNAAGEYSIRYDGVGQLFEDKEKNIWISTNKGLYRFNPPAQLFKSVMNLLPGSDAAHPADVTDFLAAPNGEILVSTWGDGIFSYDTNFNPVKSTYVNRVTPPGQGMTWCITMRKNGDIWRGVQEGYLFIYEAATGRTLKSRPPVFENSTIRQVAEDKNGDLWLGTQRGYLVKWDAAGNSFRLYQQFKSVITRIYVDEQNHVWVCTAMNGVYMVNSSDGNIITAYSDHGPKGKTLPVNGASDIIQYNDSLYAIAGKGLGLLNKNTGEMKWLNKQNFLPTNNIINLVKDKDGYIWMSAAAGILSYHPLIKKLSTYNEADGVQPSSFNIAASALLPDGRILFGTNHDFIVFNPSKVTVSEYVPPLVDIAGIAVMNVPLPADSVKKLQQVTLGYEDHSLVIELTTLTYQNTYNVYYMMEGLDKDWVQAGKDGQAIFNYLAPGKYTFMAACRNARGNIGRITRLEICIEPPFWKTWWFLSLLVLLVGALFFLVDHARMKRKAAVQKMRSDIAGNLHEEVNTALSNITILSEMAKLKADSEPRKSKEFIEQISSKSQAMTIAMDDMLWSIAPENDSMQKTIERMQELIDGLSKQYNVDVQLLVDEKVTVLKLNMQFRHEVFLLFKESISGLLKAGAGNCKIHAGLDKNNLLYTIEFANANCDMQLFTNLLQSQGMQGRREKIKATMNVETYTVDSVLSLRVPLA